MFRDRDPTIYRTTVYLTTVDWTTVYRTTIYRKDSSSNRHLI